MYPLVLLVCSVSFLLVLSVVDIIIAGIDLLEVLLFHPV